MLFHFWFTINSSPPLPDTRGIDNYSPKLATDHCQCKTNLSWYHSFSLYVIFVLSLALHSKATNWKLEFTYIFSIAVHVFRNLFLKICPLFGQILIACLKCLRASFSPSSYSKKMRWGRGCVFTKEALYGKLHFLCLVFVKSKFTSNIDISEDSTFIQKFIQKECAK